MILYLVFKVIDVVNNTKKRKSLERIVNFFISEGDTVMKNLFAQAVANVDAEHAAQPISGNEQDLSAQQDAEAPTQAEVATPEITFPEIPAVASDVHATVEQANVVQLVSPVAEVPADNEEELKLLLSNITWLPVKLPEEPYSIMGLPASTFDRLWGAFNVRLHKTSEEQRVAQLLDEVKSIRDGEPAKKVGWNNPTPWKSCWNMQLFLFF